MDPDHEGVLEDKEDFHEFRDKVSESVKDVAFIIGSIHLAEKVGR